MAPILLDPFFGVGLGDELVGESDVPSDGTGVVGFNDVVEVGEEVTTKGLQVLPLVWPLKVVQTVPNVVT
jgi:hypothetical protein